MARPIRMFQVAEISFVTARCLQRLLLLRPSIETNEVLSGVLARAVRLYGVELFAFHVMSNHMHLIVRAPAGNLPRFMQYLMTNTSKKVGALVGWRGAFWERRYSAEPILDGEALVEKLRYVFAHGVKEGLVRRCLQWPGLSSLPLMLDGKSRQVRWFNWTRRASGNASGETRPRLDVRWEEPEELRLASIPHPRLQKRGALRRFLRRAVNAIEEEAAKRYRRVLGRQGVLRQKPRTSPGASDRKKRPLCHTTIPGLLLAFRDKYRGFLEAFRQASVRWRAGDLEARFPEAAIKPFVWPSPALTSLAA